MQQLIIIMENSKTLFWSSKFPWARERISSKFIESEHASSKMIASPCLVNIFRSLPSTRITIGLTGASSQPLWWQSSETQKHYMKT
jgi:hypothetical protein